jgi:alpha-galactosidase
MSGETRTPKASEHAERSAIPLGFDQLRDVQYGFKAPRFDVAYDGKPITIGGTTYGTGIGMHAWTHMWFEVPQGAVALEATIGLSDAVTACDQALVTFEVWNDEGRRIYDSGPVHGGTLPQRIHVPLDATPTIELVLTEGGNRRDCDHGNWGDAIFTLGP